MKKTTALLPGFLFMVCAAFSQSPHVSGTLFDSLQQKSIKSGVVCILRSKDSVLQGYARTDEEGAFAIGPLRKGDYFLLASFSGYADYSERFLLGDDTGNRVFHIGLIPKSKLLDAVIVSGRISAVRIKGDTLEYKADSFYVPPNGNAEDLLRRLPGVQVDRSGKITVNGQPVQKVLVDGEEFFGDDPTLVTQNIRADIVEKVQIFDKKSELAARTGINDGKTQKTINLVVREDRKNGHFGKGEAGLGSDGYFNNEGTYNQFHGRQKLAAYGILSNTGAHPNWQEQNNFSDYSPLAAVSGGNQQLVDWSGNYEAQGYPLLQTGGLHYDNRWNKSDQSVNANVKSLQLYLDQSGSSRSEYILPDTIYFNNQRQNARNSVFRNKAEAFYSLHPDSMSTLEIRVQGMSYNKNIAENSYSEFLSKDSVLINNSTRVNTAHEYLGDFNSEALYVRRFRRKGRSLSVGGGEESSDLHANGVYYSDNRFYSGGTFVPGQEQLIDQRKTSTGGLLNLYINGVYSEPLSPRSTLLVNEGVLVGKNNALLQSFTKNGNGEYKDLDTAYSSNYALKAVTQKQGLHYLLTGKSYTFSLGSDIGETRYNQQDPLNRTSLQKNFTDFYPQASIQLRPGGMAIMNLVYLGSTQLPSPGQLQPVQNNTDPLNIVIGNPLLRPAFVNDIHLSYMNASFTTGAMTGLDILYRSTENPISTSNFVDSFGRRVTQSVNTGNTNQFRVSGGSGSRLKALDLQYGINGGLELATNRNIVNEIDNTTHTGSYSIGLYLDKSKPGKYDISFSPSGNYNTSKSSILESLHTNYWSINLRVNADVYLPAKFQFHTDCRVIAQQKTAVFSGNSDYTIWNAFLSRKFLKNESLVAKLAINDILGQNKGISRSLSSNFISQNNYSLIQRYAMISINWNFNTSKSEKK